MTRVEKKIRPVPIGVENFEDMIKKGYYYVDKTLLIQGLLDGGGEVNVFTRPRRFGKSLNISMLEHYFGIHKKDSAPIFEGLNIMQVGEKYLAHQNKYPVVKMTLKGVESTSFASAFKLFKYEIMEEFVRYRYVLENPKLDEKDKLLAQRFFNDEADVEDYKNSLRFLTRCLHKYYNEKVIILIDEYDVPLEKAYFAKNSYYDEMVDFLRKFYGNALKTNDSLNFAVITGCLRVSKESIFTGVNNLNIMSIVDNTYGEYFGFTEPEVELMLESYNLTNKLDEMREWYNGYKFGETTVCNPWSSIRYLYDKAYGNADYPRPHWSNTSSNSIIRDLIAVADDEARDEIEHLIKGGTITKPIYEDIVYADIMKNMGNLWNFLFFTGYLKKVSKQQIGVENHIELGIPNKEILYIYIRQIREWFEERTVAKNMASLYNAVFSQDVEHLEDAITELLRQSISYMDSYENFYHGFLVGVLHGVDGYRVVSNRETGNGRSDVMLRPHTRRKPAVVIEVKVSKKRGDLVKDSEKALTQIVKKNYQQEFEEEGYEKVIKYGISFYRKDCAVATEKAEF